MNERSSVNDYLNDFRSHGSDCAFVQKKGYRHERWSYAQVADLAAGFAAKLEALGLEQGDRLMLWGENSAEWVGVFFGCALRGVIVVPIDHASTFDFVARVAQQVEPKLLVGSRAHILENSGRLAMAALSLEDISQTLTGQFPHASPINLTRYDTLQIVFTSGTTAEPKGVVITHGNVLANVTPLELEIRKYLRYERYVHPIRFLNLLPLSHVFGQFLGMFLPPLLGGTVIFQPELSPSEVINTIHSERVSVLVSVPRVLQALREKFERDLEDRSQQHSFRKKLEVSKEAHFLRRWWIFRSIRRRFGWKFWAFISGGAALDRDTEEFWRSLGYAVIQGYGLTETTSLVSLNHPFRLGKGSIGKVLPGREVKLAPDGEILVRGAGVASGYWDHGRMRGVSDHHGWYRTGDLGELDTDGNLYFKGRKKEVIVTPAGTNVYPEDLEAALRRQPEVKDCVVVGIERAENAEPCAVIILRQPADLEPVVLRANEMLAEYQRMRMWMEWPQPDFPRTSTQKPRRNLIAAAASLKMQHPNVPDTTAANDAPLSQLISRVSGRAMPVLREDAALDSDLGLSSLDRVAVMSALEDRYQVDLSETGFNSIRTVGDLNQILRGEKKAGVTYHYPAWTLRWPVTWVRLLAHYLLLRPSVVLLGWPRIEGRERLRGVRGPLLVVANHIAGVDPGFILTALPGRFRHRLAIAAGGEALEALRISGPEHGLLLRIFDRLQWFLGVSLLNLFPLPREGGFRRSFAYAGLAIDRGYSVLVFPEGRHTIDGNMNPFRAGIGLLAQNLGIPVLPMRIKGLFEVKVAGRKFTAPGKIQVRIGTPLHFDPQTPAEEIARSLWEAVNAL